MILIFTSKLDGHVEPVSNQLDAAGVPWVRINTEDFATNVELDVSPTRASGQLWLKDSKKIVRLEDVTAVWYRKPEPVHVDHFDMEHGALDYVEAEFTEQLLGLYALLNKARWINNPFNTRIAHRKLLQLKTAAEIGFNVPATIITNSVERAIEFSAQNDGDIAIKSLGAISVMEGQAEEAVQYGIFTRRITNGELAEFADKIPNMPTLFQQFIPKDFEMRITCVEKQVFACKIQTRADDITSDDYRFDTANLLHTAIDVPELTDRIYAYMDAFNLNFACFDFIVSRDGEAVFLECNCNGQWYWVEQRTGQPISKAIADLLVAPTSP